MCEGGGGGVVFVGHYDTCSPYYTLFSLCPAVMGPGPVPLMQGPPMHPHSHGPMPVRIPAAISMQVFLFCGPTCSICKFVCCI